jgi:hypothetical protein
LPKGKPRPIVSEKFSSRGLSGHAATLEVVVEHGKGEIVLPSGFRKQTEGPAVRALEAAGFILPDPDGGAGPEIHSDPSGDKMKTRVRIRFVPLPDKPGRHQLTLPPVPITISRASGALITACTESHTMVVDDPIANTPNPEPRKNPQPRRQLERWTAAEHVVYASLIALAVGAVAAWLIGRWMRRPKPVPPPPPPRPPWEIALEELFDIRHAGLIKDRRFAVHFDRVSNSIRKYLGDRFGFDGPECTTRETLSLLRMVEPGILILSDIEAFLREADLVKFARLTPSEEQCEQALNLAEQIVKRTIPEPSELARSDAGTEMNPPPAEEPRPNQPGDVP